MKTKTILALLFACQACLMATSLAAEDGNTMGLCKSYISGDTVTMVECKASTLDACRKEARAEELTKEEKTDGQYSFTMPGNEEGYMGFSPGQSDCKAAKRENAIHASQQLSFQWGYFVYSADLKAGDSAFVLGTNVVLRSGPSTRTNAITILADRTPLKIIGKSEKPEAMQEQINGYWFNVTVAGKTGWIYGKYVCGNFPKEEQ